MNIYADRGNLIVLEQRCAWRGMRFELASCGLGDALPPGRHIYYLGGGQDRDQLLCAADLRETKADGLRAAAADGAVVLGVCGGYQLLGRSYTLAGEEVAGVGLLDVTTVRGEGARLIGNVAIELLDDNPDRPGARPGTDDDGPSDRILAGFENHGGRTTLGPGAQPLGRVLKGHGNDGESGFEGARAANVIGTYIHGPLLPKNAWFADWLIATALGSPEPLPPLDDTLEDAAHEDARRAAGV
jgi:CobQ-like glutamine amidotransferase family enzyme